MSFANTKWKSAGGMSCSPARVYEGSEVVAVVEGDWVTSQPAKRAALIAAAPELYSALKELLLTHKARGMYTDEERQKAREEASRVLAKARGENV